MSPSVFFNCQPVPSSVRLCLSACPPVCSSLSRIRHLHVSLTEWRHLTTLFRGGINHFETNSFPWRDIFPPTDVVVSGQSVVCPSLSVLSVCLSVCLSPCPPRTSVSN